MVHLEFSSSFSIINLLFCGKKTNYKFPMDVRLLLPLEAKMLFSNFKKTAVPPQSLKVGQTNKLKMRRGC